MCCTTGRVLLEGEFREVSFFYCREDGRRCDDVVRSSQSIRALELHQYGLSALRLTVEPLE